MRASGQLQPETQVDAETSKKRLLSESDDNMSTGTLSKPGKKGAKKFKATKLAKAKPNSNSEIRKPEVIELSEPPVGPVIIEQPVVSRKSKDLFKVHEISPFEHVLTYKCQFCSKRSQYPEKIERHLKEEHSARSVEDENIFGAGFKTLTRDQVRYLSVTSDTLFRFF